GAGVAASAVLVDEGHGGLLVFGGDLGQLLLGQVQIARIAGGGFDPFERYPLLVIGGVDEVLERAGHIADELSVDVVRGGPCRGVEFAFGARDSHGAGNPLPPLLPTAALTCDLTDEVMTRQLAQVVARRAGGFAEALGQARRRLRS